MKKLIIITILLFSKNVFSQQKFTKLDDLLQYATSKNITIKNNDIRLAQAKKTKLAAAINVLDPQINNSLSYIDNTKLPVNVFNGQEFQLGTRYNTNFNANGDLKLLNFGGWENLKLAKINIDLVNSNGLIATKSIQENLANVYYNIVTLQEQLKSSEKNLAAADTLYQITVKKNKLGLVKQQDVNDTKVSFLTTQEAINQLKLMIKQYYISLKIIADIPENESITIDEKLENTTNWKSEVAKNELNVNNAELKEKYALSNFKQNKKSNYPTLSFMASQSNQQYNQDFTVFGGNWVNSNYVGLKLVVPIPNATSISKKYNAKYEYQIAKQNTEQAKIKSELDQKQLENDFEKAISQFKNNIEILTLRTDSYNKNKNLYLAGILGLDQTLNSYNAMVNAEYLQISSQVNVLLATAKIEINNKIK